ncbi:hypothetical protein MNBD_GAMMA01-1494, partial [hydrothermal vent metagenome]
KAIFAGNTGFVPAGLASILTRLNLNSATWLDELNQFKTKGQTAVGTVQQLRDFCKSVHKQWRTGIQLVPALE